MFSCAVCGSASGSVGGAGDLGELACDADHAGAVRENAREASGVNREGGRVRVPKQLREHADSKAVGVRRGKGRVETRKEVRRSAFMEEKDAAESK
jgi:hypothetical protein